MRRWIDAEFTGAVVMAGAAGLVLSAPAEAQSIDPVHIYDRASLISGNGARFLVRNGCATVTAGHVVASTNYPEITPQRQSVDTANVVVLAKRLDVAIIRQNHADPRQCGVLPTEAEIEAALRSGGNREVRLVDSGGASTPIDVDLVSYDNFDITLRIEPGQETTSFQPGNSGSLVVFGGVPVGIITDAFTGLETAQARAIRLDYVLRNFSEQLSHPVAAPRQAAAQPVRPRREPYDLTQLPSDFQEVVLDARLNRRLAEQAAEEATKVERAVNEVVRRTRSLQESQAHNGIAWFRESSRRRVYRGEVELTASGTRITSVGYGLFEFTEPKYAGDKYYCNWPIGGDCDGFGVYYFGYNENNTALLKEYRGTFVDGEKKGYGYLAWKIEPDIRHTKFYGAELWGVFGDTGLSSPEVWNGADGRRYEGYAAERLNGLGVIWDQDGQVQYLGRWKNGKLIEDVTQAWRKGTYIPGSIEGEGK